MYALDKNQKKKKGNLNKSLTTHPHKVLKSEYTEIVKDVNHSTLKDTCYNISDRSAGYTILSDGDLKQDIRNKTIVNYLKFLGSHMSSVDCTEALLYLGR